MEILSTTALILALAHLATSILILRTANKIKEYRVKIDNLKQ